MDVAVLSLDDPHRDPSGGNQRIRSLVDAIGSTGARTELFFPARPATTSLTPSDAGLRSSVVRSLRRVKRTVMPLPTEWGGRSPDLDARLTAARPGVVVTCTLSQAAFGRHATGWRWVDFMDLWSELAAREAEGRRHLAAGAARAQSRWLARGELRRCGAASLVTAVGWSDCELLRSRGVDAQWLPVALPDERFADAPRANSGARSVGLLANFGYWPNVDAYERVVSAWLPRIRAQGWEVVVAGVGSDGLGDPPPGVRVLGPVDDLADYYDVVAVSLAPVNLGGGMKVKVLESLAYGVPVVASDFALEGFPPSVRAMCRSARLDGTDFPSLSDLPPVDPRDPALDPFRLSCFTAEVARLMSAVEASDR